MKVLIGLGNIGNKYANTRHNVGFRVVDELARVLGLQFSSSKKLHSGIVKNDDLVLAKPTTMMNDSGKAAKVLASTYRVPAGDLYVIHDDLDLALGEYKIQFGRGPKVHNGIASIESALGTVDFWRVRIGIDNRDPHNRIPGQAYVLGDFTNEENQKLSRVIELALVELEMIIKNHNNV